jgi:hypothetical protein
MSRKDRRDGDRRPGERRDSQPEDEQQRHTGEPDAQEGDSLTALKAILAKAAAVFQPLQLTQDECVKVVEQMYGSVLEMDLKLAGETDDKRKASVSAHIQNTTVTRGSDNRIFVEFPALETLQSGSQPANVPVPPSTDDASMTASASPAAGEPSAEGQAAQSPATEEPARSPSPRPRAPRARPASSGSAGSDELAPATEATGPDEE